ncbi:MAG: hypothetical protein WDM84_08080 [Bauldia sp.]
MCPTNIWSPGFEYVSRPASQLGWARGNGEELEGDAQEDCEDSDHSGIGDMGGLQEQTLGEPSLGAREDFNQIDAWSCYDGDEWVVDDGEPALATTAAGDATGRHPPTAVERLDAEVAATLPARRLVGPVAPSRSREAGARRVASRMLDERGLERPRGMDFSPVFYPVSAAGRHGVASAL